ncbi:hypothetical protein R3P38DRAFT_3374602 [Favolaschia claudopus]|uniref:Uncharacterized protein n=1 Tax=Favolaschia claudopus TaxID=2862362 RepID=A0AAV9ZN93_9AGAR
MNGEASFPMKICRPQIPPPLLAPVLSVKSEGTKEPAKTVRCLHRKPLRTDRWLKGQEGSGSVPRRLREWMSILHRLRATLEYYSLRGLKSLAPQAIPNGLPTLPATQQGAAAAGARPEGTRNRTRQHNQNPNPARPRNNRRTTRDELFLAARKDYQDPPSRHDLGYMNDRCPACGALHWVVEQVIHPPKNSRSPTSRQECQGKFQCRSVLQAFKHHSSMIRVQNSIPSFLDYWRASPRSGKEWEWKAQGPVTAHHESINQSL